jgi:predicted amidohydrolase
MVTRSIENRVFTATANRTGEERGLAFSGNSQITSPQGDVIMRATTGSFGVEKADLDLKLADDKMITERNHLLGDRRPEIYRRLVEAA